MSRGRFEAEYDQGHGWRDFQKESREMIHYIANILTMMQNLTFSSWTWVPSLMIKVWRPHMVSLNYYNLKIFEIFFLGRYLNIQYASVSMRPYDWNFHQEIKIFIDLYMTFALCYYLINRCKLWKLSRAHSYLLVWPRSVQRHHDQWEHTTHICRMNL